MTMTKTEIVHLNLVKIAFAVANELFAEYGLEAIRRQGVNRQVRFGEF